MLTFRCAAAQCVDKIQREKDDELTSTFMVHSGNLYVTIQAYTRHDIVLMHAHTHR